MGKFRDIVRRFDSLTIESQKSEILTIVRDNKEVVIDLNTEQQLFKGLDALGGFINPPYRSPAYATFKLHLNPLGVVDLKYEGNFYRGFVLKADSFPVTITSTDSKTKEITKKYGDEIFGLDKKNLRTFVQDYVKPAFVAFIRRVLFLR